VVAAEVEAAADLVVAAEAECERAVGSRRPAECRGHRVQAWARARARARELAPVPAQDRAPVPAYRQGLDPAADRRLELDLLAACREVGSLKEARDRAVDYQEGLVRDSARAPADLAILRVVVPALAN
jgi:hypothetical protein